MAEECVNLIRPELSDYAPASNLMLNEKIKALIASGKTVYHLAFGQSPFPLMESARLSLAENADKTAYMPVAGI